jgi:Predicted metal-dependent membrane protease
MQGLILCIYWGIRHHGNIDTVSLQRILDQSVHYVIAVSALISLFIYDRFFQAKNKNLWRECNFGGVKIKVIIFTVLLGVAFNCFFSIIDAITSFSSSFPDYAKAMEPLFGGDFGFILLINGAGIPVFEEILYRGIIFNGLKKYLPLTAAVLIQGLIFGLFHFNVVQGVYCTILGIFAALVYQWFGSILAPIALHAAFNSFSVVMSRIGNGQIFAQYYLVILLGGGLLLGFSLRWLYKSRKSPAVIVNNTGVKEV